ncbi:chromosome condensation protein CrcB [Leucobacter luti]|nr:CrcB family protein [Leucobacter luti]MBL3700218.1 chromosome condensation protein CrcB [Leucobacter luti]
MLAVGIAVAGGLGAAARFAVDRSVPERIRARFPIGIVIVNLTGSFALGLLAGAALDDPIGGVLATGFLGGYTTFSTASLDTLRLLRARRFGAALLHGPGVLCASVALAVAGILLARA